MDLSWQADRGDRRGGRDRPRDGEGGAGARRRARGARRPRRRARRAGRGGDRRAGERGRRRRRRRSAAQARVRGVRPASTASSPTPGSAPAAGLGDHDDWAPTMRVNIEAHITAAQLLVPAWLERGEGLWVTTASAAGRADADRRRAVRGQQGGRRRVRRVARRSPTATAASRSTACARWASTRTCSTPAWTPTRRA